MSAYRDKCRFCLAKGCDFHDIFGDECSLGEWIRIIFGSNVLFDASKPAESKVCDTCHQKLTTFHEYYKSVLRNQKLFAGNEKFVYEVMISSDANKEGQIPMTIEVEVTQTSAAVDTEFLACSEDELMPQEESAEHLEAELELNNSTVDFNHESMEQQWPAHLKCRSRKIQSDAQIREFVKLNCDLCTDEPHRFHTFKELQLHFTEKHQTRGYVVCCDRKIYRKDRILNHITNHVNPDAFKCPICNQISKSKILLRIHMKQHLPSEDRPFHCSKCPQKFVLKSQLTNHEATHLSNEEKRYVCDECGKAFALKFVMAKHKLTHSKTKDFVCDICAKSFATSASLQAHRTMHNSEPKPRVQCKHCNQWYKNVETLRSHQRRHRDQRKHLCSVCGKECSTNSSLSAHMRYVHLKISEYKCAICQRQFRRRLELTEHMARQHTGEVLYRCSFCPKTFASSSNYFAHRKNRHANEEADKVPTQLVS